MRNRMMLTFAGLALLGTITFAQNVSYDFDKATDFSRLKTYTWVRGTVLNDELNHTRIVNAVNTQLAMKGLTQAAARQDADVLVAYHASFDRDLQITGFASGWGGYRFAGSRTGSARTEEILTGTLIVDMVNPVTKTIVWRGIATKDVDVKANPEKREKNINRAVEKLFKKYPGAPTTR